MFSLDIVDTDAFLDLPASSQSLYFHLGMRADDDGFISSPRRIASTVNASADDLKLLIAKGFIIPFASGVCVVRDWRINNYIQRDRYTPTLYAEEKSQLESGKNGRYLPLDTKCIQNVSKSDTQVRLGKDNIIPSPTADCWSVSLGAAEAKRPVEPRRRAIYSIPGNLVEPKTLGRRTTCPAGKGYGACRGLDGHAPRVGGSIDLGSRP